MRKFNLDAITGRLIYTYRGTTRSMGRPSGRRSGRSSTQQAVILLLALWPAVPLSDLLHRSPLIEGTGEAIGSCFGPWRGLEDAE